MKLNSRIVLNLTLWISTFGLAYGQAPGSRPIPLLPLLKNEKISIITISKGNLNALGGAPEYHKPCEHWKMSNSSILEIIKYAVPLSTHDFMYLYGVLPCEYRGIIKIGTAKYRYSLNAGAFMKIITRDSTYYYEFIGGDCSKYFLSGSDSFKDADESKQIK